jgi:hypothetical protein
LIDNRTFVARGFWLPLSFMLFLPWPALAWNAAGHRLVASIAWSHLDPGARTEAARLLREHPDSARWIKRAKDSDPDRAVFIECSTWPDEIRKDQRFFSASRDEPTPVLPGYPDMERRSDWHYVTRPLEATTQKPPLSGQIDKQLGVLSRTLGSHNASDSERRYALPWLIHTVGDAHQPLHTTIRRDTEGEWDKLGTGLKVINPFNPRKSTSTLHAFWDDLPGPPWLRGERLDTASQALIAIHPRPLRQAPSDKWIDESWQIARQSGYPAGSEISETFFNNNREIANRRIAEAGYRLADLLNRLLGANKPRD